MKSHDTPRLPAVVGVFRQARRGGRRLRQTGARFFSGDQVELRDDDRKYEDRLITRPCSLTHSGYGVAGVS